MGNVADLASLLAGQVTGVGNLELVIDLLFRQRLAQLPVLRDRHDNRNDLATVMDHIVSVTGR